MPRPWWLVAAIGCAAPTEPPPGELVVAAAASPLDGAPERSWRPLANQAPFGAAAPLLLTDGTVMVQQLDTESWWRLTPDLTGSYARGTWSQRASLPAGYSPLYAASGVLPDGRVVVEGGEYIAGTLAFSARGAIYDPVGDTWQEIAPPAGWTRIGDASGIVLPNGRFMLANCCTRETSLFDAGSLTWSMTGAGKADVNDEESWTLLPDGSVLTVDCNNLGDLVASERYDPPTGVWSSAGDTPVQITDTHADNSGSHEVGPAPLLADGRVLALGGNGHDAIFDPSTNLWSVAPDLPDGLDIADGPAALLPNGAVLLAASVGVFNTPTHFLEFDGVAFGEVAAPPNAAANSSYNNFMLLLPTGELMLTDFSPDIELYTPARGVVEPAVPVILSAPELATAARETGAHRAPIVDGRVPLLPVATLYRGRAFQLEALRPNGISEGSFYGDDQQSPTNYPLVRLTITATGHVFYCRTYGHTTRSIAPDTRGLVRFDVPAGAERGAGTLEVIANGISSPAVEVNVE